MTARTHGERAAAFPARWALLAAFAMSAMCAPDASHAQSDPPTVRRVRVFRTDSSHDTTSVIVTMNADQVERMIRELMLSKATEQTLAQAMRDAMSGQGGDSKKARELSEALRAIAQKNAGLVTRIEMNCAGDHQPDGYIGVQFSELQTVMGGDVVVTTPLRDYPKVDSVYAGSPANRAGLRRGDVVMTIGGQDARRPIQLDKLLRPSTKVPVRFQRDGATKEVTVVVEKRPADYNSVCANVDQLIGQDFDAPMIFLRAPRAPRAPGAPGPMAGTYSRAAPEAPKVPLPPTAPAPSAPPAPGAPMGWNFMFGVSGGSSTIAGATLMPLDDDWRATLGVDNGVLVARVLPGTPAKDAGLRSSDVIISADGEPVASTRALSRILSNAKSNAVKLQIIRGGKQQVVVLKWE